MRSMNTLIVVALASCLGCTARTADMYARDTGAVLATKNEAIQACYDGVLKGTPDAKGRVTVKFDVETDGGRITNVAVDTPGTTAPTPVVDCVTQNLSGLAVTPPDSKKGKGTWVYQFGTDGSAVSTTAPPPTTVNPPTTGVSVTIGGKT